MSLLSPNYVLQPVSNEDLVIASLAWGFTIGFGWLTTWTACKQTILAYRRQGSKIRRNTYIWMIWSEVAVCFVFSVICWLHLWGTIPPSFWFYFAILTFWALQVQFLLQIVINRCGVILPDPTRAKRLKIGVAIAITAINISVYTIWVPARLQISPRYIWINEWWDRCEKCLYLIIDAGLNIYFIRVVQQNLVRNGLEKYRSLVRFNKFIICFSLSMDVLIIAMMSLPNTFVYMQFHPLAYIVKLNIEMSMAELIVKVAKGRKRENEGAEDFEIDQSRATTIETKETRSTSDRGSISCHIGQKSRYSKYGSVDDIGSGPELPDLGDVMKNPEESANHNGGIYTTREVRVEFQRTSQLSDSREAESEKPEKGGNSTELFTTTQGRSVYVWNDRNYHMPS
ncbi:hypothetical protein F4821DRAFT_275678 [Hypoxylon rubiginosum]|uniref:Uncharacterized protein n=1 Tax=Hypoxylon rubiginosum TaxID=110542 RepID=A0ACC0CK54_9PEZI|nr:hypothetical protein F4821DRAFT_275678 [Hypoxylon rubiginosum]